MTLVRRVVLALAALVVLAGPALAVLPSEELKDPALEHRARVISEQLRCLVCQNELIDNSNADLAHDLRVLVRQRLVAGDTDQQVIDYIVARYGEFVLLKPRFSMRNALLWGTPVILLLAGGVALVIKGRGARREVKPLSDEEKARLDAMLREPDGGTA